MAKMDKLGNQYYKNYVMATGAGGTIRRVLNSNGSYKKRNGRIVHLNNYKEFDRKTGQFTKSLRGTVKRGSVKTKGRKGG